MGTLRWILIFSTALSVLMLALAACGGYDDQDIDRMLPIEASPEDFERVSRDTAPKNSELTRYLSANFASEGAEGITIQAAPVAQSTAMEQEGFNTIGGSATVNDAAYDITFFRHYGVNPFIDTEDDHLSTFAMDVDTASYTVARRFVMDGNLPDPDSVRVGGVHQLFRLRLRFAFG